MHDCKVDGCLLGFTLETRDKLQQLEDGMTSATQGVSNFRDFQKQGIKFFGFARGVVWTCTAAGTIFLVFLAWLLSLVMPAVKIIMDDYYRNHPTVSQQIQREKSSTELPTSATMQMMGQSPTLYNVYTGRQP